MAAAGAAADFWLCVQYLVGAAGQVAGRSLEGGASGSLEREMVRLQRLASSTAVVPRRPPVWLPRRCFARGVSWGSGKPVRGGSC